MTLRSLVCILLLLTVSLVSNAQLEHTEHSGIHIVKVNPEKYVMEINIDTQMMRADDWAKKHGYAAVVNASMFRFNGKPLGLCKINYEVVSKRFIKNHYMVLAINEDTQELIDLRHDDFHPEYYHSYIQSIRMLSHTGENVWKKNEKMWSVVALGEDKDENLLLIHSRRPYNMYDFTEEARKLGIVKMMYLEGGPEASLYVNHKGLYLYRVGSYETGFIENNSNKEFWPIPVIIGVKERV